MFRKMEVMGVDNLLVWFCAVLTSRIAIDVCSTTDGTGLSEWINAMSAGSRSFHDFL